ncbi:MAG: DUF805 domain-containing protein [Planctomycetaceae bacterium]|jgi:uncharacterized membrane protein YhaH (DUF805 family)|nr:DUF805 domain-containing protein [Planctomycetaceae bacterium]
MPDEYTLTAYDQWFFDKGYQDPITLEPFRGGDNVVVCADCKMPHLVSSWEYNGGCASPVKHTRTIPFNRSLFERRRLNVTDRIRQELQEWYFGKEFFDAWKRIFDFKGRSRRKDYGMFLLYSLIGGFAMRFFLIIFFGNNEGVKIIYLIIHLLVFLPPQYSLTVRRLHDIGHSGWGIIIFFIPLINCMLSLYLMIRGGQHGINRWGANPKEIH